MTGSYIHYLCAGGLGDVFREGYFHNVIGVLKRFKIENPRARLKLLLMTHNPASAELLVGQPWIDEVKVVPFVADDIGAWPACYHEYKAEFEGHTELRFNVADARSNYRSDLAIHRPSVATSPWPIRVLTGVGTAWEFVLTSDDWAQVEQYAGATVFHPYAGDFHRTVAPDIHQWLMRTYGDGWLTIGAQYDRVNHAEEGGVELNPRVLVEVLRRARRVIGTESAVYYIASMLQVPTLLLYRDGHAFSRWVNAGDDTWDWFFNRGDPLSSHVRMPLDESGKQKVEEWILT